MNFQLGGHIKVYTDNKAKPLIEAYDPFVLPVKYVSFASYQGANVEFLYNCVSDKTTQETNNDVPDSTTISNELSAAPLPCRLNNNKYCVDNFL